MRSVRPLLGLLALLLLPAMAVLPPSSRAPSVASLSAAAVANHSPSAATPKRPNVVVIMTDDMRADDIIFAPGIQQLMANQGLTMSNAFSPYPLCCPARASFLTGQHAHNHGVLWHKAPYGYGAFDDSRTLATSLSAVGYRTGLIGKYLNRYGIARSKVSGKPSWKYVPRGWTQWRAAMENPHNGKFTGGTYHYLNTSYKTNRGIDNKYSGKYQTHVVGDFSVDMAKQFGKGRRPFFMVVNYVAPHHGQPREKRDLKPYVDASGKRRYFKTPYVAPEYRGVFDALIKHASGVPRRNAQMTTGMDLEAIQRSDLSPRERQRLLLVTRQRAESIYAVDLQVMRLVRTLKRTGAWDNTVFVFTSDNGYFLGENIKLVGKTSTFEPTIRIPLLITGPGMRGTDALGHQRHDPITLLDLTATILDLADAQPPRTPDGVSRVTTLVQGDQGWTVPVLLENTHTANRKVAWHNDPRTGIGIRTSRWSMTRYRDGRNELYDLVNDPLERRNIWNDPAARDARDALTDLWTDLKDCVGANCTPPLPTVLSADVAQNAEWTERYWGTMNEVFGQF